jgi:hypothetical protein
LNLPREGSVASNFMEFSGVIWPKLALAALLMLVLPRMFWSLAVPQYLVYYQYGSIASKVSGFGSLLALGLEAGINGLSSASLDVGLRDDRCRSKRQHRECGNGVGKQHVCES